MSKDQPPKESTASFIKSLTDIASLTAGVIGYLVALFGLADVRYPKTASVLTILLTSVLVVQWRWRKFGLKKEGINKKGKKPASKASETTDRFLDVLRSSESDPYVLPLIRRRIEAGIMVSLSIFALAWFGLNLQAIITEWTKIPGITCNTPDDKDKLRVVIADLYEVNSQQLLISDKIYDALVNEPAGNFYTVCRLTKSLKVITDAEKVITDYKADVVIWGRNDVVYQIHLEAPGLSNPRRKLSELASSEASSVEFQLKEPEHISFVTEVALSELLMLHSQAAEAQGRLETALASVNPNQVSLNDLANAYFLLGLFYHPDYSSAPNEQKAIDAYTRALDSDETFDAARLNRGMVRSSLGDDKEALEDFNYLIEKNTPLKGSAYINRSFILMQSDPDAALRDLDEVVSIDPAEGYFFRGTARMNNGDYPGAIADFEKAIQYDPQGYYNYHLLGQSQLYAGQYAEAEETYIRIVPYLNEETRQQVIDELREDAQYSPEIAPAVEKIIAELKSVSVPNP